jgi:glycosyltransferase involved in cell wall biosynthesis
MGLVRILLVSQMYPGPNDPDLGTFVRQMELALRARGHEIDLAVLDRRGGGKLRYLELAKRVRAAATPDVVYAHFLVPSGLIASRVDAPLVVTAHGRDVRNVGTVRGLKALTRKVVARASSVVCVSDYLRLELEAKLPAAKGKTHVIDMGVDIARFSPRAAQRRLESPAFVCAGSLSERKNVVRLADAFATLGEGSLTFLGDGPLRAQLEGRPRVDVVGSVPHEDVPGWLASADVVVQPSLIEPFGQSLLEAMACARPVVATRIGGPPEFVTPETGVLVDPTDLADIARGLRLAASLPRPNDAARAAAAAHDVNLQAEKIEALLERAVRDRPA